MSLVSARRKFTACSLLCLAISISGCPVPAGGSDASTLVVSSVSPLTSAAVGTSTDWPITAVVKNTGSASSTGGYVVRFAISNAYSGATVNVDATITTPLGAGGSYTVNAANLDKGTTLALNGVGSGTNTVTVSVINKGNGTTNTSAQQAVVPVFYSMLVVETYFATGPGANNFYMDLFGTGGDTAASSYIPWDSIADQGVALGWSTTAIDFDQSGFPYINYPTNIAPNSDFYVRIRGTNPSDAGAYAIRVSTKALPLLGADLNWYYATPNPTDVADQVKPSVGGIGVPTVLAQNVIVVSPTPYASRLNRYIHAGTGLLRANQEQDADVDWVKIHLP
jgi:hypothetical protein